MHQHTVEVGNVLIVDNKTPVRLKKAVGRQQLQPVWHGMDGFKVLRRGVDDHFFPCASTIMIEETGRTCTPCLVSIGTFISLE